MTSFELMKYFNEVLHPAIKQCYGFSNVLDTNLNRYSEYLTYDLMSNSCLRTLANLNELRNIVRIANVLDSSNNCFEKYKKALLDSIDFCINNYF